MANSIITQVQREDSQPKGRVLGRLYSGSHLAAKKGFFQKLFCCGSSEGDDRPKPAVNIEVLICTPDAPADVADPAASRRSSQQRRRAPAAAPAPRRRAEVPRARSGRDPRPLLFQGPHRRAFSIDGVIALNHSCDSLCARFQTEVLLTPPLAYLERRLRNPSGDRRSSPPGLCPEAPRGRPVPETDGPSF